MSSGTSVINKNRNALKFFFIETTAKSNPVFIFSFILTSSSGS